MASRPTASNADLGQPSSEIPNQYPPDSNSQGRHSSSPSSSEEDLSGEDEQLDPKFVVRSTKSKLKADKEKANARKDSSKIHVLSTSSELPHHASKLSRSITDFVKGMIGCGGLKFKLPLPPSTEELQQWLTWIETREDAVSSAINLQAQKSNVKTAAERKFLIRNQSEQLKQAVPRVQYTSASSSSRRIPKQFQISCDNEFKSRGFPRITFDWESPHLDNSEWNSATADILAQNWYNWSLKEQNFSKREVKGVDARAVIERWLTSMRKKFSKDNKPNTTTATEDTADDIFRRHKQQRKKPHICVIFKDVDTVSDYEDSPPVNEDPVSVSLFWRSRLLTEFVTELDKAALQMTSPQKRSSLCTFLSRKGCRNPTEEEADAYPIPPGLPLGAYDEGNLSTFSILERRRLGIPEKEDNAYTLNQALVDLKKLTHFTKPGTTESTPTPANPDAMQIESTQVH
ncbi:hypothetical protein PGTUg99_001774 [Puccinia graminis f. sp. tritici]|uniref:Uncharacterized protein n=1 Tax=Puccinia graminis f. sp. tritici TaxID=56615 RepID=A0A5B0LHK0_PUCGR|nr:hypothetical protein PGTUg99_006248 [Puccinia graminis f. sp. tritici]KAA1127609.1 hypothetical protein PGTUg99_001774 [Puccinia graminis f. sp. tritici]